MREPLDSSVPTAAKRVALAVHGVGNPGRGEIEEPLRVALDEVAPGIVVVEHNWNQSVALPDLEDPMEFAVYGKDLFCAGMTASCLPVVPEHRKLNFWTVWCGRGVENMAPFQAALVPFPLYMLALWTLGLHPQVTLPWFGMLLGGIFCVNVLLGALSLNREVFWGCFRCGLLPGLWAPLSVFLMVSMVPWPLLLAMFVFFKGYYWLAELFYPGFSFSAVMSGNLTPMPMPGFIGKQMLELLTVAGALGLLGILYMLWPWAYRLMKFQIVTKVVADIFLYLGDATYRMKLRKQLAADIQKRLADGSEEIVLCAHSLGTVVTVDALSVMDEVRAPKKIRLVTAGSPLRRTFWRFFPALFPPPDEVARALKARHHGFQWVNVYRPLDYVGTRLGLRGQGLEAHTWQWRRLHSNYWGDVLPVRAAHDLLVKDVVVQPETTSTYANLPKDANKSGVLRIAFSLCVLMVVLGGAALTFRGGAKAVNWVGMMWSKPRLNAADFLAATDKRTTTVRVQYFPKAASGGWAAEWAGMGMNVRFKDRGLDNDMPCVDLVDTSAIARLAKARGSEVTPAEGLAYFEVVLPGIEVASDPRLFTVDEAPPQGWGWKIGKMIVGIVIGIPISLLVGLTMKRLYDRTFDRW